MQPTNLSSKLNKQIYSIIRILFILMSLNSCKKYLDEKPVKSLKVPTTYNDLQALLDLNSYMNLGPSPGLLDLVTDDYYVASSNLQSVTETERLNYLWDKTATNLNSWQIPYTRPVYYSNVVIDQLDKIGYIESDKSSYNNILGSALFFRAFAFHSLAQLYCKPYSNTSNNDLGIVLRLNSAIEEKSVRSTIEQTYQQIITDLKKAAVLLPEKTTYPTRPTKVAALAALARVYITMRDYSNALVYADSALKFNSTLINYTTLSTTSTAPITRFNSETIFYNYPVSTQILTTTYAKIDSALYALYDTTDLRKSIYFAKNTDGITFRFKGSYAGNAGPSFSFNGLVTDELFLIKSECQARAGLIDSSMNTLNYLLITRFKPNAFIPYHASSTSDAIKIIKTERRKELVLRGQRWSDLRRYNLEGDNITLTRLYNNTTYTLPPNDLRWVMLIPLEVTNVSGITQNPR